MPEGSEFDIYQADAGYVAVTSPIRRRILDALAARDLELTDLVRATKRSKSTLSNLHVRELLRQGLVEELPHATDSRRKVYRLRGRRIGSSSVPIDQLRHAVRHYVSLSPLAHSLPLADVLDVLRAGHGARGALRAQAEALGGTVAHLFTTTGPRDLLTGVAGFWEREGLARVGKIDLDRLEIEVEVPERAAASRAALDATAIVLAGVLTGIARSRLAIAGATTSRAIGERRIALSLPRR